MFNYAYLLIKGFSHTFALANLQLRLVIQLVVLVWQRILKTQVLRLTQRSLSLA
ncbi:hypothetical protein [Nostoc commune]|uniref:hypothetical protein n=1 Tax=Nostoc commune TaxID=1178 RepID=UPI0018C4BD71|nr:hypothetical protein [Nostoc commune]